MSPVKYLSSKIAKRMGTKLTVVGALEVMRQSVTTLFQFFASRGPDYLKPGEGCSLALSETIDVVVISVSQRSLFQIRHQIWYTFAI